MAVQSDALVLFGATGDLAHKMIYPALYAMAKHGTLDVPVIGVAASNWGLARLQETVAQSVQQSPGFDDQPALDLLLSRLDYVSGNYAELATFQALRRALGDAQQALELRRIHDPHSVPVNTALARIYDALGLPELAADALSRIAG